jgi:hypothetical protein
VDVRGQLDPHIARKCSSKGQAPAPVSGGLQNLGRTRLTVIERVAPLWLEVELTPCHPQKQNPHQRQAGLPRSDRKCQLIDLSFLPKPGAR